MRSLVVGANDKSLLGCAQLLILTIIVLLFHRQDVDAAYPPVLQLQEHNENILGVTFGFNTIAVATKKEIFLHKTDQNGRVQKQVSSVIKLPFIERNAFLELKLFSPTELFYCDEQNCGLCTASDQNSSCSKFDVAFLGVEPRRIEAASAVQTSDESKIMLRVAVRGKDNLQHGAILRFKAQNEGVLKPESVADDAPYFNEFTSALAFERNNYSYFVGSTEQPDEPMSKLVQGVPRNITMAKLIRICSMDKTALLESRISIPLDCGGNQLASLQSAFYDPASDNLHVVVKTTSRFEVCTYVMSKAFERFEEDWNICQDTSYTQTQECDYAKNINDWKDKPNCMIYTHATSSHSTEYCSRFGGSEEIYGNCQLDKDASSSYRYGWLESYRIMQGTVQARFPFVFDVATDTIPSHDTYFISGQVPGGNKVVRINMFGSAKEADIVWQAHSYPLSNFPITASSDQAVLMANVSQLVLAKLTCRDLYQTCQSLADGGFKDPLGCAWCNKKGEMSAIAQNDKTCSPVVKYACPPKIMNTFINHNSTALSMYGNNMSNLKDAYVSLCNDACIVTKVEENFLDCEMESNSVINRQCNDVALIGQLGDNPKFSIPIELDRIRSEESIATQEVESSNNKKSKTYRIIGATIAVFVVLILIVGFLWFIRDKLKHILQVPLPKPRPSSHTNSGNQSGASQDPFQMTRLDQEDRDHSLYLSIYNQEVPKDYQIPYDEIELGKKLGSGYYGDVFLGTYNRRYDPMPIACKTIKPEGRVRDFFKEAIVMTEFSSDRVLKLIGVAYRISHSPIVVTEFMSNGDLVNYLRNEANRPTLRLLLKFATQIAEGMEHIQSRNYIHRDLAARNCMLDENLDVKVADFGLCREVNPETMIYETSGRETSMPVRWMAIESLTEDAFGKKSDVWSFGILLWELMTRGSLPYGSQKDVHEIKSLLMKRYRLPIPEYCPPALYQRVMLACWQSNPEDRPSFTELQYTIKEIIDDLERSQNSNLYTHYERVSSTTNSGALNKCTIPETPPINSGYAMANGGNSLSHEV